MFKLLVSLNVSSAARSKLGADAIILGVVGLIAIRWRKDVILIVRRISLLAFHLTLKFLRAEVNLQHKVILQLSESVDVLLLLNVLFSKTHSLHLIKSVCTHSMDLIQASVAALVQLGHDEVCRGGDLDVGDAVIAVGCVVGTLKDASCIVCSERVPQLVVPVECWVWEVVVKSEPYWWRIPWCVAIPSVRCAGYGYAYSGTDDS
jgi:hypothetical protein